MKDILTFFKKKKKTSNFNSIKINFVSPKQILTRSYGEVTKPETINYRTHKVEKGGLFCARIFGPMKDYECLCGKYKKLKHRGVMCEKCGVEVVLSKARRSRMANITLAAPVAHVWFLKSLPSTISLCLDMTLKNIEKILYYEQYIVTDDDMSMLETQQLLSEDEYIYAQQYYGEDFTAKMGAAALFDLLKKINPIIEIKKIEIQLEETFSDIRIKRLLQRQKLMRSLILSKNKPENMILSVLPVLPPDLRPLVPLEGGRFASSDLNDLYKRVINRNNRLKKLKVLDAPDIIIKNEKRMLQESVDALLDNGKRGKCVLGSNKQPLKSLADMIKGKQGRFRFNLLGKRVDYSGRSVIVSGPNLKLNQCGLPYKLAIELFKPFIIGELIRLDIATTIKKAKYLIDTESINIWSILKKIIYQHPVLLNRAPTLHRLGIQAFDPVLIKSKAIQLHPLVCAAFNADFDGDQMAVHVPLTLKTQAEARILMMSTNNLLSPANGEPIITPSQDMVLGLHYLSKIKIEALGENKVFKYEHFVEKAYENNILDLHAAIYIKIKKEFIKTTFGRILIKQILPKKIPFELINKKMKKKEVSKLVKYCYKNIGLQETIKLVNDLMFLGFQYATKSGMSIGISDLPAFDEKIKIVRQSKQKIGLMEYYYLSGFTTKEEKYNKTIDTWSKCNEDVSEILMKKMSVQKQKKVDGTIEIVDSFNPVFMMTDSGARGSITQIRQLAGMRGLMATPDGSIIETPITASFKEGLDIIEYFISTHGARKGLTDTALKTANSGYLTRRLVDVSQDVVVRIHDCQTQSGIFIKSTVQEGDIVEHLKDKVLGRITQEDIYNSKKEKIIKKGTLLGETETRLIEKLDIEKIKVRSVIKCEQKRGICAKCYGSDLTTDSLITIGETVGVIAAQSIGEPGTQLTMRTFHIGGVASRASSVNKIKIKTNGMAEFKNIKTIKHRESKKLILISNSAKLIIFDENKKERERYKIPYGAIIKNVHKEYVKKGDVVANWNPHLFPVISEINGNVKHLNIIEEETVKREVDPITGLSNIVIVEQENINITKELKPILRVISKTKEKTIDHYLSPGTVINVSDGQEVNPGDMIAKTPKKSFKIKDITGGLPKVADIFEARRPKDPAILAKISGTIAFEKEVSGKNYLSIINEEKTQEIAIPNWKNPNVFDGEKVAKGDSITEGQHDLHDILNLLGVDDLAMHVKRDVQDVYRLQGVFINDKHIEVIIRQMLKKAIIIDPGDSYFFIDEIISIEQIERKNNELKMENKKEIKYQKILQGITKSSLTSDSFLAAASFQETTRVLTNAAINGRVDDLTGLKANVLTGQLIPAGTGFKRELT